MVSAKFGFGILVSGALGALTSLLIVLAVWHFRTEPATLAARTGPSTPLANVRKVISKILSPQRSDHLPVSEIRRPGIIDHCFISDCEITAPASDREKSIVAAALKKNWDSVRLMLDSGVPVESANDVGITPLMVAAAQGDAEMVGMLLRRQANPNAKDLGDRTALHYAIQSRKLAAVQSVLPLMSDFSTPAGDGHDLFTIALETGDPSIADALLERLPAGLDWNSGSRAALQAALQSDRKEQVRLLLTKHRTPPTREGGTVPLIAYAIANDDGALFHTLLACGSDPNIVIPRNAEKEFVSLLKSKYMRGYIQDETGINLLMLAAGLGKADYVRSLLEAGADRNRTTPREKMRALYFAAWTGSWRCAQMLLGGGPMPDELRVEVSLARQNMAVIKDGITIFTTHCSTGREGFSTPTGQYVITDKDRDHRSTIYKVPMPYFMRLSCRDFGMHAGVVASYPASHGCIRLPSEAARKLFSEIPVGTVVMIN